MQKNTRSNTFQSTQLLKTFKTKIYNHRSKISKTLFHTGIAFLILSFVFVLLGYTGLVKNIVIAKTDKTASNVSIEKNLPALTIPSTANSLKAESKSFNYDRPTSSENLIINSGGPESSPQLTISAPEGGEEWISESLRLIEKTSNPAFVPAMWAHFGKINNEYGSRRNPFGGYSYEFHSGMDIDGERGDAIVAPANGIIAEAGWQGGYGNMIEIDHGNGLKTRYGHLSQIAVQVGGAAQRGEVIGFVGSTGRSTGPHLHYELRLNDKPINPRRLLPPAPNEIRTFNAK